MKVGFFEFIQIGLGQRWGVTNTLTSVSHVTYGTEEEVREQLDLASDAWKRRNKRSDTWRARRAFESFEERMINKKVDSKAA